MNKCSNCQTEFEGDVCPSCEGKLESEAQMKKRFELSNKKYKVFSFIPTVAFSVFAVLTIVFMALLPVANINAFGLQENYGSILSATGFDEISGLNTLSIAILVVSVIALFYAIIVMQYRFSVLKYRGLFGKPLYKFLEVISVVFVLAQLIFSILIMGKLNVADEGLGIISVASYPILTIILSIVDLLAIVISIVICNVYEKSNPEILKNWKEERQKVKAEAKPSKTKKVANYAGKRVFKYLLVPVIILLLIYSVNVSNIAERFYAKSFDAEDLKQILVEDSGKFEIGKSSIENEIGTSYVAEGASEDAYNATYYTNNYIELLKKLERNQTYALLAIEQGDYRISGLLKQAKNIEIEKETLAYGKAEIAYSEYGRVQEVVYNNIVIDGFSSIAKKLDKVQIFNIVEVYSDQTYTTHKVEKVAYLATYTDGSFIYRTCENAVVVLEDGTITKTYEGSYVGKKLRWQDEFGEYEVVASANKN